VDSVGLAARLDGWRVADGVILAMLAHDSTGSPSARLATNFLEREALDEFEPTLLAHATNLPVGDTVYVVLLDDSGPGPRRVEKWSDCPPAILNVRSVVRDLADRARPLPIAGVQRLEVAMQVGPDGRIRRRRIERSSGYLQLDQATFDALGVAQIRPGSVAGIPLLVWLNFPVTVNLGREEARQ